ncbi:MAG: hypothetical protein SF187_11215 [Deltaproteobacteria bacterium]|nr:hypothetical protein [Deltaproteobacteria bacterium]
MFKVNKFAATALLAILPHSVALAQAKGARPAAPAKAAKADAASDELEVPAGAAPSLDAQLAEEKRSREAAVADVAAQLAAQKQALESRLAEAQAKAAANEAKLQALSDAMQAERAQRAATPAPPPPVWQGGPISDVEGYLPLPQAEGLVVRGFLQAQYEHFAGSEDQLQQGGRYLNEDRFTVRRARVRLDRRWQYSAISVELDGNTTRRLSFGLRRAEGSLFWEGKGASRPLLALSAGLIDVPFGFELPQSARQRLFAERSVVSEAFFPGQPDLGARLTGRWRVFNLAVAVVNGEPVDERESAPFRGDPNQAKDVVGRVSVDAPVSPAFTIAGGASFLSGKGFHPGTDATKSGTQWNDVNQNSLIDLGEITPVAGTSAVPSENFKRWALGADLHSSLRTGYGYTRLFAEAVVGSNMDRGLFVADPIANSFDVREFGYAVSLTQDLKNLGILGVRLDSYNPNADFFDSRSGKLVPTRQTITTVSPVVGVNVGAHARLSAQYDFIRDKYARDDRGVPTDFSNNRFTLRLQVDL